MPTLASNRKHIIFQHHLPELAARCGARPLIICVCHLCDSWEQVVLIIRRGRRNALASPEHNLNYNAHVMFTLWAATPYWHFTLFGV